MRDRLTDDDLGTRRTHSEAFKQSLIEACGAPGASVAGGPGERD
jgi:transposase-like protein